MEPTFGNPDQVVRITLAECANYVCALKLSSKASGSAKMTVILFAIDFVKERTGLNKLENKEVSMHFDDDNITTCEEILMTGMEQLLIKRSGTTNPFTDILQAYETELIDTIYLNDKEQLIRIQPVEKNGRMVDIHNILTFDAN